MFFQNWCGCDFANLFMQRPSFNLYFCFAFFFVLLYCVRARTKLRRVSSVLFLLKILRRFRMGGETEMCRMNCISSVKLVFTYHMMHVCTLAIVLFLFLQTTVSYCTAIKVQLLVCVRAFFQYVLNSYYLPISLGNIYLL